MTLTFADFNLPEQLNKALDDLGFTAPTMVQMKSVPPAMEGKDLLVSSQTGSGKTVAFLLPTISALITDEAQPLTKRFAQVPAPSLLVLCPTRELAQQVMQDAINLVRHVKGMRVASVMGGMPFMKQIAGLKGAQLLIATPGRLLDLVNRRQLDLSQIKSLIVDEADRMLDLGFSEDLEEISRLCKGRDQTLMFSATFADRIISLATRMMQDPVRISIDTGHSTNMDVSQTLHWTDGFEHKKKLLSHWLNDDTMDQAVVFANTQEDTELLAEELAQAGHQVIALHGAMPQAVRMRRIRSLREGKVRVLVATDVAARGLDIPTISHVINFGLPMKTEDYVHRIGRTGRAGRTGQAITLATHRERSKIRALEDYLKTRLSVSEIEGLEPNPAPAFDRKGGRGDGRRNSGGGARGGFSSDRPRRDSSHSRPFESRGEGSGRSFGGEQRGERAATPRVEGRFERPHREAPNHFKRDDAHIEHNRGSNPFSEERPRRSFDRSAERSGTDRHSESRGRRDYSQDDNRGNRVDANDAPRSYHSAGERTARVASGDRDTAPRPFHREGAAAPRPSRDFGHRDSAPRDSRGRDDRRSDRGEKSFGSRDDAPRSFKRDGDAAPRRFNPDAKPKRFAENAKSERPIRRDFANSGERKFGAGVKTKDAR